MASDRISARKNIEKLVNFFDENIYQFKSPSFNETQARQQLIDPFFEALGWDVHNRLMQPLFRQEVMPESRMKSSTAREGNDQEPLLPKKETLGKEYKEYASILDYIAEDEYKANSKEAVKKPDYRFRIGGQTKFFVEAKKPYVDLVKSQSAIFQVKRYGFSGRVPLAILTDFEEFRTFDCTQRPAFEKPKLGIIKDFDLTYKQYLDQFDHLYDTFSRDAVVGGSLEKLTKKMMLKRTGDFALDREFLEDLSKWREELARDIAKHPKNRRLLNDYTLNEAVQRILDRIVFIRVCEDREIEVENTLLALLRMWKERPGLSLYSLLNDLFKQRRALYNGLLFSQHPCEELEIGDEVLIKILENLNYPFSPYHFNEIGVEILGSIYEKFLGKTIHLAPKNVIIKEKPEVRKAGGVYYTPQYIVTYIVDNTLGKLLYEEDAKRSPLLVGEGQGEVPKAKPTLEPPSESGKELRSLHSQASGSLRGGQLDRRKLKLSPKQVAKLKIIDIACGSGSFLLGAFQKLIDYHIEWYTAHPEDIKIENNVPDAYKDTDGNYHLSPRKKRDILVNNIYGVDIDRQAVEVTQMSLYLKVLEGENAETLNPQMTLALKEVYLPSLAKNIKCGNSLIGTDFTSQGEMFDEEARHKVNPFDWEMEFPEILGSQNEPHPNPPLLGEGRERFHSGGFDVVIGNPPYGAEFDDGQKQYVREKYKTYQYKYDSYFYFIERALAITKAGGFVSYITPELWLRLENCENMRRYIFSNASFNKLLICGEDVFEDAVVNTIVFVLQKNGNAKIIEIEDKNESWCLDRKIWEKSKGLVIDYRIKPHFQSIFEKLDASNIKSLEFFGDSIQGITPYDKYSGQSSTIIKTRAYHATKKKNKTYGRWLAGKDVSRYELEWSGEWLSYGDWLAAQRDPKYFNGARILFREVPGSEKRIQATMAEELFYHGHSITPFKPNENNDVGVKYILALSNSRLLSWYGGQKLPNFGKEIFPKINPQDVKQLPIRTIDFTKPAEKKMHDDLVLLVEKMLELNKQLQKAHFDSEKEPIERQIAATDKKIDELVYTLYGLTEEEIKIVEGKNNE